MSWKPTQAAGPGRPSQVACVNAQRQEGSWPMKELRGGSEAGVGWRLRGSWILGGWRRASPAWAHLFPMAQDPDVWLPRGHVSSRSSPDSWLFWRHCNQRAYVWGHTGRHLNAATLEELVIVTQEVIVGIKRTLYNKWLGNKHFPPSFSIDVLSFPLPQPRSSSHCLENPSLWSGPCWWPCSRAQSCTGPFPGGSVFQTLILQ